MVILAVNFSAHDPELVAGKSPPPTREMILTFRQQEKLLAELMGPNEPQVAVPPKPFSPRPSSERQFEILTVKWQGTARRFTRRRRRRPYQ